MRFPPRAAARVSSSTSGYLKSFPHLAGTVFAFDGDEARRPSSSSAPRRHEDWSELQSMTDLVLAAGRLLSGLPGDRRARAAARRAA